MGGGLASPTPKWGEGVQSVLSSQGRGHGRLASQSHHQMVRWGANSQGLIWVVGANQSEASYGKML